MPDAWHCSGNEVCARDQKRAQAEKLHYLAPGNVFILFPLDGKILTPACLLLTAVTLFAFVLFGHLRSPAGNRLRQPRYYSCSSDSNAATSYSSVRVIPNCSTPTSIRATLRGTSTFTLVRTISPPNCQSLIASPSRVRSMFSRVVYVRAPDGQTVAHIGPLPTL